jgi:PAP2 superfamily
MKTSQKSQTIIYLSAIAMLLILFSIQFLDEKIALYVKEVVHSNSFLKKSFTGIPNLLPIIVLIGTAALWIIFFRVQYVGSLRHATFLKLAAIAVPAAFLLKMVLQYIFGRTNIRTWLSSGNPLKFAWFTPLSQQPCFPSGHMTVFTSFFVAVYLCYPSYRPFAAIALITLASALVITNYHFLGDVIAGFFCGTLVTSTVCMLVSKESVDTLPR